MASSGSGKRGRGEAEDQPVEDDVVTRDELDAMLGSFRTTFVEEISAAVNAKAGTQVEQLIRTYDAKIQNKFNEQDTTIAALSTRADAVEDAQKSMKLDIERLQRALSVAEATTTEATRAMDEEDFERQPDRCILRLNTAESVARDAVKMAITPLLEEAGLTEAQWNMMGQGGGIAKNFTIRFCGAEGLAARRAKKVLDMRRQPDGSWRPNPQVVTPLQRQVDIYISPDKNPKQLRTEQGCRRLFRAFKAVHPGKTVHQDKRSGVISVDWHACAKVVPSPEPNVYTVQWNVSVLDRAGVNKQSIMEAFNANTGTDANIQWQI